MLINKIKIFFLPGIICLLIVTGCSVSPTDPAQGGTGSLKITILSPAANDTISGPLEIKYKVEGAGNVKFIEFYVNGTFVWNFAPNPDGTAPKIVWYIEPSLVGETVSLYIIYYDQNGNSAKSNEVESLLVAESVTLPEAPKNVNVLLLSQTSANISWESASTGIEIFEVWRKTGLFGEFEFHLSVPGTEFNTNDTGLIPDTIYFYKVRAKNKHGFSEFSLDANTAGIGGTGGIKPPTNLVAVARGKELVRLTWNDNSNNENYFKIERRTTYTNFEAVGFAGANSTAFTDSANGLIAGVTYFYRVKVVSGSDSAWSNVSSAMTYPYDVFTPKNLTGSYIGNNQIELLWDDDNTLNTVVEIERKSGMEENFALVKTIPRGSEVYVDSISAAGINYYYRIRAAIGSYVSDYSNEINVMVP